MLEDHVQVDSDTDTWLDRVTEFCLIRSKAKIRSFSLIEQESPATPSLQVLLQLNNNSLETWTIPCPPSSANTVNGSTTTTSSGSILKKLKALASPSGIIEPTKTHTIEHQGHRADVRSMAVSHDDQVLLSCSNGLLKLWNLKSGACIRSLESGYAISSVFLPPTHNDTTRQHVVVGTKSGMLEVYDLASSALVQSIQAHSGAIWSIDVRPDKGGLVTGSADKDVKFWDIRLQTVAAGPGSKITTRLGEEITIKTKQPKLVHTKTLKMTDDVLGVKYSRDNKLLAVSLLDCTVKVFFQDTLKFFLSLYGHKVGAFSCLCMLTAC